MRMIVTMLVVVIMVVGVTLHPALHLLHDLTGDLLERDRRDGVRLSDDDRLAAVAADDHLRIDRHLAEERHAEHLRRALPAAVSEDLLPLTAVLADEEAHVLDDAE